ncbi:putative dynamin GTPase [Helianthus annuus]|nr:putative dynamin GTPase [Helianthus annuus]
MFLNISEIIMEHIEPEESIILNVLSADVDFTTCESIRMSRRVDSTGQRTLAVVTKSDRSPDGLLEKVTKNAVNIGLGYVCVRNRIDNETYDEARIQETKLFETHPLLSVIDKSMVGIPVLAHKLVQIQSVIISKCLPDIITKINEKLNDLVLELNKLPQNLTSIPDAMIAFTQIIVSLKETLEKIFMRGEFDDDLENKLVCCNARLVEMIGEFSKELHMNAKPSENFLVEEMRVLQESSGIQLPHFLPQYVFLYLLQRKVSSISDLPISFVNKVWGYLEDICVKVLTDHCENYPQLLASMRKVAQNVMAKTKNKFLKRVVEMIEMEKITCYTCDPDGFNASWNQLKSTNYLLSDAMTRRLKSTNITGYGPAKVEHLFIVPANLRDQAFNLKMRMTAYWEIVMKRMVDWLALKLRFMIQKVVIKEMETALVKEVMLQGGGIEKMLDEPPSVAKKRERLQRSIASLKESKEIIEQVMDHILIATD